MLKNIAVLIDGDNASAKNIDVVIQAIEKLGKIGIKKIYGDWAQASLAGWQEAILRHAIDPMQQFAYVKGKNATDIALVIEAMDLLHSGDYDGFCLVSSDSDFASLAVRIRKSGLKAYGFGRKEAVVSFRQACDEFFEVEKLQTKIPVIQPKTPSQTQPMTGGQLKQDAKLLNALKDVISNSSSLKNSWTSYGTINREFKEKYPNIKIENYGYTKLIKIIENIDIFLVNHTKTDILIQIKDKNNEQKNNQPKKYDTTQLQNEKILIQEIDKLIKNNPKSDNGWCNISYIASELNKNPNINLDKYGYKKFSDLITAIRLFDIQKRQNGVYIKAKNTTTNKTQTPPTPKPQVAPTVQPNANNTQPINPILKGQIEIYIYTPNQSDVVLWRLTNAKKVRNESDMIFYGQTHSEDGTLDLDINEVFHEFSCNLAHQHDDIRHIIFTASHETGSVSHPKPLHIVIEQAGQKVFEDELILDDIEARSAMFLELFRTETGWRVVPRKQMIKNDLRQLCQVLGVEVE